MQSIDFAVKDMIETLKRIQWLDVSTEAGKAGGKKRYNLEITPGPVEETQNFSSHSDISYGFELRLYVNKEVNTALIPENLRAINRQLLADKRRGQSAQTTIVDVWEKASDEGREGIEYTNTITIRILDRGDI